MTDTADDTKMCQNKVHSLPAGHRGKCPRCRKQYYYKRQAKESGRPLCENGHGLARANLTDDQECRECLALGLGDGNARDILSGALPPPETWLDWAAVHQAIGGWPLVRRLTKRELLCMLHTLQVRNCICRIDAVRWIEENTHVLGLTESYAHDLVHVWAPQSGLARPMVTVQQALLADVTGESETVDTDAEPAA